MSLNVLGTSRYSECSLFRIEYKICYSESLNTEIRVTIVRVRISIVLMFRVITLVLGLSKFRLRVKERVRVPWLGLGSKFGITPANLYAIRNNEPSE